MVRPQKPSSTAPRHRNQKAANALGYAKRKSSKPKPLSNLSDIYEYHPEKVRRSKLKLELEGHELVGGSGNGFSDDEHDGRTLNMQPRLVGENDDEDIIGEDEDEEIDSDAAFEETDEERFAGFDFSRGKKTKSKVKSDPSSRNVHFAEIDLNEGSEGEVDSRDGRSGGGSSEEEEEEGDADEFIDVLDVLDGRAEAEIEVDIPDSGYQVSQSDNKAAASREEASEYGGTESESDNSLALDGVISASEGEDDEEESSPLQNLENFITTLNAGQKRKASEHETLANMTNGESRKRKRLTLKEETQVGTEGEFAAQSGASRLNLDDLLAPLASSSSNLGSLQKSAKVLSSTSSKTQTLAAPLPQRAQERLDREAAYEQTKEEVDKWSQTMKHIREAQHLSFPLQSEPAGKTSNLELAAKFKPTTELESAVDRLLKSAKMREEDIVQTESLKMNHLSVEEVASRRAELAKMRELVFRAEAKAKRVSKIKSKMYRRIKKKEKAKLAAQLGESVEGEDLEDEEGRMKREIDRARERATLRHKNTGKWAKAMKLRGELDENQRRDINEMLDRGEKLRRKIQGHGSGSETEDDEDESVGDGEDAIRRIKAGAFNELAKFDTVDNHPELEGGGKGKSIFDMKFMKDAMARDQQHADKMVDDFVKEVGGHIPDSDDENAGSHSEQAQATSAQRTGGRVSYHPGATLRMATSLASDTSSVTLKSSDLIHEERLDSPVATSLTYDLPPVSSPEPQERNPWLVSHLTLTTGQKKHEVAVSKDSTSVEKSTNKLRKRQKQREQDKEVAKEDAIIDVSMDSMVILGANPSSQEQAATQRKKRKRKQAVVQSLTVLQEEHDSDVNSEIDSQEQTLRASAGKARGVKAFEQQELVARAFAGDNVVRDFADTKQLEVNEDAPKEMDTTLPGWGAWGGLGTKKAPPKPYLIKKVAGVDPRSRADYGKAHVIISEKRDKKAAKYLVKDLPFPYTSKAQFERSMDAPIGTEWNTRLGFQRTTLPRVVKKMGTVVTPLEKLS